MKDIFDDDNIEKAFKRLSTKRNGGGTDEISLFDFKEFWKLNDVRIKDMIQNKTFEVELIQLVYHIVLV